MATLQDIMDDLSAETTMIDGFSVLITGLQQQIADALSGVTLPPAVQTEIDNVFAQAEANKAAITAALAAATPPPPVTP